MGNGMYWWSKYEAKRSNGERGRRPKGRGVGPGWVPVTIMPIRRSFFAAYRWQLVAAATALVGSIALLASVGHQFFYLGGAAPMYFMGCLIGIGMGVSLPLFWWARHRRMLQILDAEESDLAIE